MILNSSIRYTIIQILNEIINTYGVLSKQALDEYLYKDNKWKIGYKNGEAYSIYAGISKMVIIFDSLTEWVVKIPIMYGASNRTEPKYRETFKKDVRNGKFNSYLVFDTDLCEKEVALYKEASKIGIGEFFSEERKVMNYHGVPIYVQKRVNWTYMDSDRFEEPTDDSITDSIEDVLIAGDYSNTVCDLCALAPFAEDLYKAVDSEQVFKNILQFITDFHINDLHDENVGYDLNGVPVFFDYSGFRRSDSLIDDDE